MSTKRFDVAAFKVKMRCRPPQSTRYMSQLLKLIRQQSILGYDNLLSVCNAQYTPPTPTRRNCRVASRWRRRCVLDLILMVERKLSGSQDNSVSYVWLMARDKTCHTRGARCAVKMRREPRAAGESRKSYMGFF